MGLLWVFIGIFLLAITKYVSSLSLNRLKTKVAVDSQEAVQLKEALNQASQQERALEAELIRLESQEIALKQVVDKLGHKLSEFNKEKPAVQNNADTEPPLKPAPAQPPLEASVKSSTQTTPSDS